MRLPQAIRGLFKRGDESALLLQAAGAATPRPSLPPTRAEKVRLKHFESRLRSLAHASGSDAPLVAGRLQIIALSRVKERLGQDWARLATRVHRLTRRILERRLADEDVYVQVGDCYMILFARLTSVEATFKARTIAREITGLLIGDLPEVDEAPIQIIIHEIDPGELRARPTLATLAARMDDDAREPGTTDGGGRDTPRFAERAWRRSTTCRSGAGAAGRSSPISALAGRTRGPSTATATISTAWRFARCWPPCRTWSVVAMRLWWWRQSTGRPWCSCSAGRAIWSSAGACTFISTGSSALQSQTWLPAPGAI